VHNREKESLARLLVGFVLDIGIWAAYSGLSKWSTIEREFRLTIIGSCLAALAIVLVLPVFWRGIAWHAPLAFLLLVLPGFAIFSAFRFVYTYW